MAALKSLSTDEVAVEAARSLLDLPRDSTTDTERRQLLERVENSGFIPDAYEASALAILYPHGERRNATDVDRCVLRGPTLVDQEVDRLAKEYFQLNPTERRLRWMRLQIAAVEYSNTLPFVQHLEQGLNLGTQEFSHASAKVQAILSAVCELYVMRPAERARHRRELVEQLQEDRVTMRTVMLELNNYREWQALDPAFFTYLDTHFVENITVIGVPKEGSAVSVQERTQSSGSESGIPWHIILPVIVLLGSLGRISSIHHSNYTAPTPTYRPAEVDKEKYNEALKSIFERTERKGQEKRITRPNGIPGDVTWSGNDREGYLVYIPDTYSPEERNKIVDTFRSAHYLLKHKVIVIILNKDLLPFAPSPPRQP